VSTKLNPFIFVKVLCTCSKGAFCLKSHNEFGGYTTVLTGTVFIFCVKASFRVSVKSVESFDGSRVRTYRVLKIMYYILREN
jgi:hypothetical protein